MNALGQLQRQFQEFLLESKSEIDHSIVATEFVSTETRLSIYKEAYHLRLIESLTSSYPGLYAFLGTEQFENLCRSYIVNHPSHDRSIRWYGDKLADFIKQSYRNQYLYLPELADFEWKLTLAFDAEDVSVVQMEDMFEIAPELWAGMKFKLHPSLQRLNYLWNVIPVWQHLVKDEEDMPALENQDKATPWILWRKQDYMIHFYSMSPEEAWSMDAIIEGASFGALCEGLCQWIAEDEVGMKAASYLKAWIQQGMVSRLLFNDELV